MNIIISVDENYVERAKTMLFSLAQNNSERISVYLLQSSLSKRIIDEFIFFVERSCHGELNSIAIPIDLFDRVPKNQRMAIETYYRLLAFEMIPHSIDRAMWLDADIIVKGDISEFYHQDFCGKLAVVCAERDQRQQIRLCLPKEALYFNAGVILFNLPEMRRVLTVDAVISCIDNNRDRLALMDQDVLNLLLMNRVKYCDSATYNNGVLGFSVLDNSSLIELGSQAKIIHYWGAMKPWNWKGANWADKYWWEYEWKRGRIIETISYRLLNTPIKIWHILREVYFIALGQVNKLMNRSKRK